MSHQSGSTGYSQVPMEDIRPVYSTKLNLGEDDQFECIGYRGSLCGTILYCLLCVFSVGLLWLVFHWKPEWKIQVTKQKCFLSQADTLLIKDQFKRQFTEKVIKKPVDELRSGLEEFLYCPGELAPEDADDDTTALTVKQRYFLKYFDHQHVCYIWTQEAQTFKRLCGLDNDLTCAQIHDDYHGVSPLERQNKLKLYGENTILVEVKSYGSLLVTEVLNPFYIFQIFSVALWASDEYYIYASCIVLISCISLGVSLYETRKQSVALRDMVKTPHTAISIVQQVGENSEIREVDTSELVPGDVILVPAHGCIMSCDAVLLAGNVIVNESMLTGESVPVTKTPLTPSESREIYDPDIHKRHTLFCGTKVIQTRYYGDARVKAVVVRTGYMTAKGELVRSILFPKPMGFKFYRDAMKFIGFLGIMAIVGMTYSVIALYRNGEGVSRIIIRALDIVTIVVPPALPAAMTVGTVYAQSRLKNQGIFCISPPRINVCGKIKLFCFDKTGTLTEDGLDLWGVVPLQDKSFLPAVQNPCDLPCHGPFVMAMGTCHSLTIIDGELTGDPLDINMFKSINWLLEEPGKDTAKFDCLVPTIVKPITSDTYFAESQQESQVFEVGIVRQFTFSSSLQRMSVITRTLGENHMNLFAKGAPEKIASLCKDSSIPDDFHKVLTSYTKKGLRVIALAWKPLDPKLTWHHAQKLPRETVESDLMFLGLLVMENKLKPQTTPVILQLKEADIRTVMVTGDNMLTAVSVARQCGMVHGKERVILVEAHGPENGNPAFIQWQYADTDTLQSGEEEEEERKESQELAKNAAEEGIGAEMAGVEGGMAGESLHLTSEKEKLYQALSIDVDDVAYHFAVSGKSFGILRQYFSDLLPKICIRGAVFARMAPDQKSQLVEQLQDVGYCVGMCGDGANDCGALKTAHAGISLSEAEASVASPFTSRTPHIECVPTVIREGRAALVTSFGIFKYMALYSFVQFVSVLILYSNGTNLGDWMFLYIDLVITTTVAVLMGHTGAYRKLVSQRPPGSLVGPGNILSIILHILLVISFQTGAFVFLTTQKWYHSRTDQSTDHIRGHETTVVFYVSCFQYLTLAFCFSKGPPYRKSIWTNVPFLISLIFLFGFTTLLVLYPFDFLAKLLELKKIPDDSFDFLLILMGIIAGNFVVAVFLESVIIPSRAFKKMISLCRKKKKVPTATLR